MADCEDLESELLEAPPGGVSTLETTGPLNDVTVLREDAPPNRDTEFLPELFSNGSFTDDVTDAAVDEVIETNDVRIETGVIIDVAAEDDVIVKVCAAEEDVTVEHVADDVTIAVVFDVIGILPASHCPGLRPKSRSRICLASWMIRNAA